MSAPLIETRGLSKHFGGVQAVRTIDFSLAEGELRCLIGPNGAGKSTFFKFLTGQIKPTSGAVLFRGIDITALQAHRNRPARHRHQDASAQCLQWALDASKSLDRCGAPQQQERSRPSR